MDEDYGNRLLLCEQKLSSFKMMLYEDHEIIKKNLSNFTLIKSLLSYLQEKVHNLENKTKIKTNFNCMLLKPLDDFEFPTRILNTFKCEKHYFLGDIVCYDDVNNKHFRSYKKTPFGFFLNWCNLGKKSLKDITIILKNNGIKNTIKCPEYFLERLIKTGKNFRE